MKMITMNFLKTITTSLLLTLTFTLSTVVIAEVDLENGANVAGSCVACHGVEGVSSLPDWPHLAGQVPGYIAGQLAAFKSGTRKNAVMQGMVLGLDEQDMADVDAFYAAKVANAGSISEDQEELAKQGEKIFKGGLAEGNIPSCMGCHGPAGHGVAKNFPRVAGQHAKYLEVQLLAFKKGERKGFNNIMSDIAFKLSEQQIKALAIYMSGLN